MPKNVLPKELIQEGKEIYDLLTELDETSKMMVLVYAGALRDKQMLDKQAS